MLHHLGEQFLLHLIVEFEILRVEASYSIDTGDFLEIILGLCETVLRIVVSRRFWEAPERLCQHVTYENQVNQLQIIYMLRNELEVHSRQYERQSLTNLHHWLHELDPLFLLELLRKINTNNNSAWEAYTQQEHIHVELLNRFGKQKSSTCHNQYPECCDENPLPAIHVGQESHWNDCRCYEDSNKEASSKESNPLLTFAEHVRLRNPVIDVLRIGVICKVLILLQIVRTNILLIT